MTRASWLGRYIWSVWAGATGLLCLFAAWQAGHEVYGGFVLPSPLETLSAIGEITRAPSFASATGEAAARSSRLLPGCRVGHTGGKRRGLLVCRHAAP